MKTDALFWSLVVLNVFDVVTTKLMMDVGGVEANPLLSDDILTTTLLKIAVLLAIWSLMKRVDKPWVSKALYATVLIYAVVVGINIGGMAAA